MNRKLYVIDTCALISYFGNIFNEGSSISKESLKIIDNAFKLENNNLIFPSAVFVEIFKKFCNSEENKQRIKYEIYQRIKNQDNMEIQPLDYEVMENFIKIVDIESDFRFDNQDKQVYAAAMTMNCPLITSDTRLKRYNERKGFVPEILT